MSNLKPTNRQLAELHRNNAALLTGILNLTKQQKSISITVGNLTYRVYPGESLYLKLQDLFSDWGNEHCAAALCCDVGNE